jgi:hypothetical protein
MNVNDELGRKMATASFLVLPRIYMEAMKKTSENVSQNSQPPGHKAPCCCKVSKIDVSE